MTITLTRWGNSLGLRIPKDSAGELGLLPGSRVQLTVEEGRIVISPVRPRYRLADLLTGMTPEDRSGFDWGPDLGREIVDD